MGEQGHFRRQASNILSSLCAYREHCLIMSFWPGSQAEARMCDTPNSLRRWRVVVERKHDKPTVATSRSDSATPKSHVSGANAEGRIPLPHQPDPGSGAFDPNEILALQQLIGNRAVQRLLATPSALDPTGASPVLRRMPYKHGWLDRAKMAPVLLVKGFSNAEIDQLWQGVGATTVNDIGSDVVVALKQHAGLIVAIPIIQQLSAAKLTTLAALSTQCPPAAFTLFLQRSPLELEQLLDTPLCGRPPIDLLNLAIHLCPPPTNMTSTNVFRLASLPGALAYGDILWLHQQLSPTLALVNIERLLQAMVADGLTGARILNIIQPLRAVGQTGAQIEALVDRLRGNLDVPANPADPAARPITDVPALVVPPTPAPGAPIPGGAAVVAPLPGAHAPPPVLPVASRPGTKGLSGPDIETHLTATTAAGRGAPTIGDTYPTGQDFSLAHRPDMQLWDDLVVVGAGAVLLPNVTVGQPAETVPQRLVRQKLALAELRRRHAAQAEIIQSIFSHDEGASPRPFVSILNEDSYHVNAHNSSRHVLGGANMQNIESLAWRAMSKVPQCGAVATAFNSVAEADIAVANALAAANFWLPANWYTLRNNLATGVLPPQMMSANNLGVALRKTDAPRGQPYPALPPAAGPVAARPLIDAAAAIPVAAAVPPVVGPPAGYTHHVTVTGIVVRLRPSNNQAGKGWCVYTTYPQP